MQGELAEAWAPRDLCELRFRPAIPLLLRLGLLASFLILYCRADAFQRADDTAL